MTEGNPFFAKETLRLLAAAGPLVAAPPALLLPQSVRDAIGRRLDALSPACNEALRAASVLGREFEARHLSAMLPVEPADLLPRLGEAIAAGIVSESPSARGRFAFAHALVRQTLYEELPTPERVEQHRRAGTALEAIAASAAEPPLAELAHHFYEAAQGGAAERALAYSVRAAERAARVLAWEEGARHYERALEAEALLLPPDPGRRCELLLALGEMRGFAGERDAARATFVEAAALARRGGDAEALARAAIGHKGLVEMGIDDSALGLLEEALAAVGDTRPAWRARLLARLVGTPPYTDSMETREALSREALALARASGDEVALGDAWNARYWACLGPDRPHERLAVAAELVALGERTGDRRLVVSGREGAFGAHVLLGDRAGAEASLAAWLDAAQALRQPSYLFLAQMAQGSWAATLGRFDEAQRRFDEALEQGRRTVPFAALVHGGQLALLSYYRADMRIRDDAVELFDRLDTFSSYRSLARYGRALAQAMGGELEKAREVLDALPFGSLPRDENWLLTGALATDVALLAEDASHAQAIHDLLLPYGDLMLSHDLLRVAPSAVAVQLGSLCRLLGRFDAGEAWLERAVAKCTAFGSPCGVLGARAALLRLLRARGRAADRRRADALEPEVIAEMRALGIDPAIALPWLAADAGARG
jgi:tetratricopeptide (TPR) repeat protein